GDDNAFENSFRHLCQLSSGLRLLGPQVGLDARDVLAHLIHAVGLLDLAGRLLEAQVELLLLQADQLFGQLVGRQPANFVDLHHACSATASMRVTMRFFTGSLAAPRRRASRATSSGTPSISNMMRPGWTRAAQYSTAPLPLPIRTSAGLSVTGTSGKMRIHTRPWRFIWRVIARRAASIWRAVTRSGCSDFSPCEPKFSAVPPFDAPWMRPLNCLRYLVFFGCIMAAIPYALASARRSRRGPRDSRSGRSRPPPSPAGPDSPARRLSCAIGSCSSTSPLKIQAFTPMMP